MNQQGLEAVKAIKKEFIKCRSNNSGGSFWPGSCALEMDPDILSKLSENTFNVLITGTNGKTTTTRMAVHMLEKLGISCLTNKSGANRDTGIITAYGLATNEMGHPIADHAIMECDEKHFITVAPQVHPEIVLLTNLSEDQQSRLIDPLLVYKNILATIQKTNAVVCVNDNCEYFQNIEAELPENQIVKFCGSKANIIVNGKSFDVDVDLPGKYNYENLAGAAAILYAKGVKDLRFSHLLQDFTFPFGRLETFKVDDTTIIINLAKNKVSVTRTLELIAEQNCDYLVILGFNANKQDGYDSGWIDTVEWQNYRKVLMNTYTYGAASERTINALRNAGIASESIADFEALHHILSDSEKPVFMVLNYTCMLETRNKLADMGYLRPFWEI